MAIIIEICADILKISAPPLVVILLMLIIADR